MKATLVFCTLAIAVFVGVVPARSIGQRPEDQSHARLHALHAVVPNAGKRWRHRRLAVGLALENEHAESEHGGCQR